MATQRPHKFCPSMKNSKGNPQQEQYGEVMKFNLEKQGAHIPCSLSISWEQELHLYGRVDASR